jgi:serine/threonine protein kinase
MIETLQRLTAALADRYRVERELGAGGMATVYLAHDLKHQRDVAIKLLHPDLGAALGGERFLSEVRTTARLQHPHILPLLDSGEADGLLYYVMPYVTGETLRARLERERQLPIDDALRIAREVADALGAAHALGIVHRDVKPENILLQGGHALVADFGIALAVQQAGGQRITQTGLSLGTPQYMSPEQAMGEKAIDARSDIYALGAVTYEMLVGEPPFTGPSVQAIVARLLTEGPRTITAQRKAVSEGVEAAVLRALEKLPADRFATAAEFAAALASTSPVTRAPAMARRERSTRTILRWSLPIMLGLALGATGWVVGRARAVPAAAMFDAALPDSAPLSPVSSVGSSGFGTATSNLSIAPDGSFFVYTVQRGDSTTLWHRSLVDASAHPIVGTAGGTTPRVSPDGTRLAFFAGGRIMVVPLKGGEPRRLMDDEPPVTLEWVSPTRLLVLTADGYKLAWLDPEVGVVEQGRITGSGARCVFGQWIAEEKQLLCSFNESATFIDPATGRTTPLRARAADGSPGSPLAGSAFRIVGGRYMTYLSVDGSLLAASYDRQTHMLGRPVVLVGGIKRDALGSAQMALSENGLLGFASAVRETDAQLVVLREGAAPSPLAVERALFLRFDLTRDRRTLAGVVQTPVGQELRIYDLRTGRRQTWLHAANIKMPLWSPRGDRLVVHVASGGHGALLLGSPSATVAPDTLLRGGTEEMPYDAADFLDDSTILARDTRTPAAYRLHLSGRAVRVDTLFADAFFPAVSPDGKRIAWHSSALNQLFVGSYPRAARQHQIATGAVEPIWLSPNELLYRSSVTWYRVQLDPATGELAGPPTVWGRDTRFLDTPGWSNRPSWDGGIIYSRSSPQDDARYLRFIPDFVTRVKAAVDAASR